MSDPARVIDLSVEALRALVREEAAAATPPPEKREILTSDQAGEILQIHPSVVIRYVKDRGLPGFKVGAEWRFRRSELDAWIDAQPRVTPKRQKKAG